MVATSKIGSRLVDALACEVAVCVVPLSVPVCDPSPASEASEVLSSPPFEASSVPPAEASPGAGSPHDKAKGRHATHKRVLFRSSRYRSPWSHHRGNAAAGKAARERGSARALRSCRQSRPKSIRPSTSVTSPPPTPPTRAACWVLGRRPYECVRRAQPSMGEYAWFAGDYTLCALALRHGPFCAPAQDHANHVRHHRFQLLVLQRIGRLGVGD